MVAGRYSGAAAEGFYIVLSSDTFSTFKCMFVPTFSKLARQRFIPEIAARKQIHVDVAWLNRILVLEFRLYRIFEAFTFLPFARTFLFIKYLLLSIPLRAIFHWNLNFSASLCGWNYTVSTYTYRCIPR